MTKQPENVDSESANQSANTGNPMCSTIWGSDTRRVYRSSIVSLWYLSPSCHSLPFRRRRVRPESDAESNHGIEWKELNLCWAFLGGLGLKEEFVKLNPLLLNSSSPTHHVLPNSTVSFFLKNGDGEDTHAQTPTRGNSTAVKEDDVLLHLPRILSPRTCNKKLHKTTQLPLTPSSHKHPHAEAPWCFSVTSCTQIQRFPGKGMGKSSTSAEHPPENTTYATVFLTLILTDNISLHQDLCFGLLGIKQMSSL